MGEKASTFEEAVNFMNEFFSLAKMETVSRKLGSMHITQYEKEGNNEKEAFSEIAKICKICVPRRLMNVARIAFGRKFCKTLPKVESEHVPYLLQRVF